MTESRAAGLLAVAVELEQRDATLAAELDTVGRLTRATDRIRDRVGQLTAVLAGIPGERTALDSAEPDLDRDRRQAVASLDAAADRLARLQAKRRVDDVELDQARREQATAAVAVADAEARLARLRARRVDLDELETAAGAEIEGLDVEAANLAREIAQVPRISDAGRSTPGTGLDALADWAARAHAALLVVRTQLDTERERVVREANELGSSVLGEPLGGSSVSVVRRRIERSLGDPA